MKGQIVQRGRSFAAVVYLGPGEVTDRKTGEKKPGERRKWTTFRAKGNTERDLHEAKRVAERYLHQAVATLEGGGIVAATRSRVAEHLEDWLRGHGPHVAPTTLASYRDTIAVHLSPALGHHRLAKLSPQVIRDYVDTKLRTGLSPTTVRYHLAMLKMALHQAVRDGLLPRNVAALVKAPPKAHPQMRALDVEQAMLFLGEARRSSPHYRLYLTALLTGARQGELAGLRWQDCDFVAGRAAIQQTVYRLGGSKRAGTKAALLFKAPKTARARRTIPLAPELVSELLALRDEQQARKRRLGERYHDHNLVFCQPNGKPLVMHNVVRRDFHEVLARAKVPQIRFHDLRHSVASLLLARGVHVKVVQELLGHQSALMTLDVYSHAIPALQEQAVHSLASVLLAQPSEPADSSR